MNIMWNDMPDNFKGFVFHDFSGPYREFRARQKSATPEVPATNDPKPFEPVPGRDFDIDGNVWAGSELEEQLMRGEYIEGFSAKPPAEVPADGGALRDRLVQAIHIYWHGPVCTEDDQPQSEHYKEANALLPFLANELQEARDETVRKVEDWFWRNSESTVENHVQFNSEVDIL